MTINDEQLFHRHSISIYHINLWLHLHSYLLIHIILTLLKKKITMAFCIYFTWLSHLEKKRKTLKHFYASNSVVFLCTKHCNATLQWQWAEFRYQNPNKILEIFHTIKYMDYTVYPNIYIVWSYLVLLLLHHQFLWIHMTHVIHIFQGCLILTGTNEWWPNLLPQQNTIKWKHVHNSWDVLSWPQAQGFG